jgi:hypothetical protein
MKGVVSWFCVSCHDSDSHRMRVTAIFEIGFHALHMQFVSGTLSRNTLGLLRVVQTQGLLRQTYRVRLLQNINTLGVNIWRHGFQLRRAQYWIMQVIMNSLSIVAAFKLLTDR